MRDLTEQLSTDIAEAIDEFRDEEEEIMRTASGARTTAEEKLSEAIAAAHQVFEVAASLRMEAAHRDMAAQITAFLGQAKEPTAKPETLPDVADGPSIEDGKDE